jgi:type II secretion system protein H
MVVVVVVGIVVGVIVTGFGRRDLDSLLAREAERLRVVVDLARERAELEASEWGLDVTGDAYRFLRYDEVAAAWQPVAGVSWSRHALDARAELSIDVDDVRLPEDGAAETDGAGQPATRGGRATAPRRPAAERPEVLLLSSGEASAFRVTLAARDGSAAWHVETDGIAPVRVVDGRTDDAAAAASGQ